MNRLNKKIIWLVIAISSIVIACLYVNSNIIFKGKKVDLKGNSYGIIDDNMTNEYQNITCLNQDKSCHNASSHGRQMCEFIKNNYSNYNIYYFNAEIDGKITSESIIDGLERLKENNIKKINISLSSKVYSNDIQHWITKNTDITIYASYNNRINTYDYPAMYEGVIASGEYTNKIQFKKNDVTYKSKTILGLSPPKNYTGNSFLSLISMLEDN